ncbi:MAG TPA: sulfurtransferase TusA family protein [Dermatophilaceae bacterium]|nr:sulfurtransferase TusA family protein [Dermatophilaceae bacterium]
MTGAGADAEVDARGLPCPVPVIRLARATRDLRPGARVRLLADDPAARADVPAWCRMRGHTLTVAEEGGHTAYLVVVGDLALRPG